MGAVAIRRDIAIVGLVGMLLGVLLTAITITSPSAEAANGDTMKVGTWNYAYNNTVLKGRGTLIIKNTAAIGKPAATFKVMAGPPISVNSSDKVDDLNADLLDGQDSTAFAAAGHDHDTDYLAIDGTAADADLLGGAPPTAFFGAAPAGPDGLPFLGATCLFHGGELRAITLGGAPFCSTAGGTGYFTDTGQELGITGLSIHGALGVALGDLDGDGDLDAFVAEYYGQGNQVWLNDGTGTLTDSGQVLGSNDSNEVALGDLDGDGDLDAAAANDGDQNKVWLNDGTGTFTDGAQDLGVSQSAGVALGDLNGDGHLDAFVANSQQANHVWLDDGTGVLVDSQSLGDANRYSHSVALGDLNGDGDLDAFIADSNTADRVWTNNGSGVFGDSTQSLGAHQHFLEWIRELILDY